MREQKAVVAIVQNDDGEFMVTFNDRWDGYAFPMVAVTEGANILGSLAIQAVEEDLGCRLPNATTEELDYMCIFGRSQRTGEEVQYEYWVFLVRPGKALDLAALPAADHSPLFLPYAALTKRTGITWSTTEIVREFVETQEAVLSIVTRPGASETEFLLVWNHNYGGNFFPVQRVKTEVLPDRIAVRTVRSDLGYQGPVLAEWRGEVTDVHFSNRFHLDRRYRFHLCEVQLPEIDLHQPVNPLERAMTARGRRYRWVGASRLGDSLLQASPTLEVIRQPMLNLIPTRTFGGPLRQSEGGLALIRRTNNGKKEWLAQWNERWRAYFFVGGHRHDGESFRNCVIREIHEELGLTASDCVVGSMPAHHLEYRAISRSAATLTNYVMELFDAAVTPTGADRIDSDSANRWLSEEEILRMGANDGRPVSVTMQVLLTMAGRI